ncbi:hypothetical protein ACIGEP_02255 [Microbacterium sp. NPDC077663]
MVPFTDALLEDGIPFFVLGVDDVPAEYDRLTAAVWSSRSRRWITAR